MTKTTTLLQLRKRTKKQKPVFVVKEYYKTARVKRRWRFPGGRHSPVRQEHRGRPALPTPGYGSPNAVKGLHASGLEMVVVHTVKALAALNPTKQAAIIASTVGAKKRISLLEHASSNNITLLNVKDIPAALEQVQKSLAARRKSREEKRKSKSKKEEEKKKVAEKKKQEATSEKKEEQGQLSPPTEKKKEEQEKQKEMLEKTITRRQ